MSPPTRRRSLLLAAPAVGWAALILFVSTRPASDLPAVGFPLADKLFHVAEYAVLALLLALPFRGLGGKRYVAILVVGLAFAVLDEVVQSTVPGRLADPADVAADVLGILLALAVAHALRGRFVPAAGTFM